MKFKLFLALIFVSNVLSAQEGYWQQHVSYEIDAALNDKTNTVTGSEKLIYKNNSPTTLDFIWFHIWPNAYKNESTALFQQIKNDT